MTLGGFILTVGLAAFLRWLVDDVNRPAQSAAVALAALAAGLTVAKVAQVDGVAAAITGALFVGLGALALGWFLLSLTDQWSRKTVQTVGCAGLGAMLLAQLVR